MELTGTPAFFVVLFFVALVLFALWRKRKTLAKNTEEMQARYGDQILVLDAEATFYGFKSKGMTQTDEVGLGAIFVLTKELLHLKSWVKGPGANFEAIIPLEHLHSLVRTSQWSLFSSGFTTGDPILVLSYTDDEGEDEEVGLALHKTHQQEAIAHIEALTNITLEARS